MRMIAGAVLALAAVQAFASAHTIPFPHGVFARDVLVPVSAALALLSGFLLLWGIVAETDLAPRLGAAHALVSTLGLTALTGAWFSGVRHLLPLGGGAAALVAVLFLLPRRPRQTSLHVG